MKTIGAKQVYGEKQQMVSSYQMLPVPALATALIIFLLPATGAPYTNPLLWMILLSMCVAAAVAAMVVHLQQVRNKEKTKIGSGIPGGVSHLQPAVITGME